jgi:hypothetical protein
MFLGICRCSRKLRIYINPLACLMMYAELTGNEPLELRDKKPAG